MKSIKKSAKRLTDREFASHFASPKNPPKGYGSIDAGIEAFSYRKERMRYWMQRLGVDVYTTECFERADADVLAKFGKPF